MMRESVTYKKLEWERWDEENGGGGERRKKKTGGAVGVASGPTGGAAFAAVTDDALIYKKEFDLIDLIDIKRDNNEK